jgi:hypothetical protein
MVALSGGVTLTGGVNVSGFQIEPLVFNTVPSTQAPGPLNIYYRRSKIVVIYTAAELNAAGISGSTTFNALGMFVITAPSSSYQPYPSYTVGMINTANAVGTNITTGWTTVRNAANLPTFTASVNLPLDIIFNTNFTWNGTSNLGIGFAWGMVPTGYVAAGSVRSNSTGSIAYAITDSAGAYTLADATSSTSAGRPIITLYRV